MPVEEIEQRAHRLGTAIIKMLSAEDVPLDLLAHVLGVVIGVSAHCCENAGRGLGDKFCKVTAETAGVTFDRLTVCDEHGTLH